MENGLESRFSIQVKEGEKKLVRDDKPCPRMGEHIGLLPVVMVSPGDSALVSDSGEERRRFANAMLSQMDREYLAAVQAYNRLLAQRNKLLKDLSPDPALLDVLDSRMAVPAARISAFRGQLAQDLQPVVGEYYRLISGGGESVSIDYKPDAFAPDRERDIALRYTSSGPQRDDFLFSMDGHPIRRAGSQGQQKSFLVALKFAQYEIMKRSYGFAPILLLDDVFDKLDMGRISNLIGMVAGADFGQIFITDTDRARLSGIVDRLTEDRAYFNAAGGVFAHDCARVALVIEGLPARDPLGIGGRLAFIDQNRPAGEDFPVLLENRGRVTGLDADILRVQDNGTVGPEGLFHRGGADDEAVVLDEGDGRKAVHVEVASVDAGDGVVLEAQGAGAVGLLALGRDDSGLETGRIVPHKGDELPVLVDSPVEAVGLGRLADG